MSNRLNNRIERVGTSTAGVLLGIFALNACASEEPLIEHDSDATSVTIKNGANIRENGAVLNGEADGVTNILFTNIGEEFSLDTPDGVTLKTYNDEGWIGTSIKNFPPDYQPMLEEDEDGIVWISEQKADVEYDKTSTSIE